MIEGNAIDGIDSGHAIIAPAPGGVSLGAAAISHYGFPLTEVIQRITARRPA
jgi:hypothetical protein